MVNRADFRCVLALGILCVPFIGVLAFAFAHFGPHIRAGLRAVTGW